MSVTAITNDTAGIPVVTTEEPKKLSSRAMFALRMKREGRYSDFQAAIADVMREQAAIDGGAGDKRKAVPEAMRRLGYVSPRKERRKYREWEQLQAKTALDVEAERLRLAASDRRRLEHESIDDEQRQFEFERAFNSLPTVADPQKEWEWLGAHPAMMRKDRAKNEMKRIELTDYDVLSPPHGAAPSKRAVLQLQHWCNAPREFYKAMIGVHRKQQEGAGAEALDQDEDLSEVERMLTQFTAAQRAK